MKRRKLSSKIVLVLLPLIFLGGGVRFAYAQYVPSQALDPDCYFPEVGQPGEIDTIYGAFNEQRLGGGAVNIGPVPGGSFGRVAFAGYSEVDTNYAVFSLFPGGPGFNLHNLQSQERTPVPLNQCQFRHFRSRSYLDAVWWDGFRVTIYWSDENGEYDYTRKTILFGDNKGGTAKTTDDFPLIVPLTNDTIDDIILLWDGVPVHDSNTV